MFSPSFFLTKQRYLVTRKLLHSMVLILLAGDVETCLGPLFSNFTIIHQNICGLLSKRENLEKFINKNFAKIYAATETHLNSSILSSFIKKWAYNCERKDYI